MSIRRKFTLYLFLIIFITSFSVAFLIAGYSERTISALLESDKRDILVQIHQRLRLFDNYLFVFETGMRSKISESLKKIAPEVPDAAATKKFTPEKLKALALKTGVSEIYFINRELVVYNTSFRPDMNFNLAAANADLKDFLTPMFGKGEVGVQRIGMSMKTGYVNIYAYYSPPGSDYIIEASIWLNDYLDSLCGRGYYDKLRGELFGNFRKENSYLKSVDLYSITDVSKWSFINEGKSFSADQAFVNRVLAEKEVAIRNNGLVTFYEAMQLDNKDFPWADRRIVVEISYDFSPIDEFKRTTIACLIALGLIIAAMSFFISSKILEGYFVKRIMDINETLKAISAGDYSARLKDDGTDEISYIAGTINSMAEKISSRVQKLEELLPICSSCKKIRDDKGYWSQVETYLLDHSGIKFTHGMCPECVIKFYPNYHGGAKKAPENAEGRNGAPDAKV